MNVFELGTRLDYLDDGLIPSFTLVQNGEFVTYTVDSVADDGTLVVVPGGKMYVHEVTDGDGFGSGYRSDRVPAVQDGSEEVGADGCGAHLP